ncbi:MAG: hypothetical protein AAF401_02135 [Pseudomonadota bacterium]
MRTSKSSQKTELRAFIAEELARETFPEAVEFAEEIGRRPGVVAVLFYGSCLQRGTTEGMLDFYALTEGDGAYGQSKLIELAGRILPPNVYPETIDGIRAKVAVAPLSEFHRRMAVERRDTTFWARFCQRSALLWVADDAAREAAVESVASAVETASIWAERLSDGAEGAAAWRALFARTYRIEIRVEPPSRAADIVGAEPERWDALWPMTADVRAEAGPAGFRAWAARWWVGKALHLSRLAKGAATFEGGARYLIWKIRRHLKRS